MSDTKNLPVITISRQYGAGGRSVAKRLAEKLDIPWYDQDFVKKTAQASGYSEEEIVTAGEELKRSAKFLDALVNSITTYTSSHDAIFDAQKSSMIELSVSPCIIVGRCGNIILSKAGVKSFDIFLHAPLEVRIEREMKLWNKSQKEAKKFTESTDHYRELYYKKYTGHIMNCADDYSISIDTSLADYETISEYLAGLIKNLYK